MTPNSYRIIAELPNAATSADARAVARHALTLCTPAAADGTAIFTNAELNAALEPLRLHPALGVRCQGCEEGVAFVALHTEGSYLVSANGRIRPKSRRGGVYDLADITPAKGKSRGLQGWQDDAAAGKGAVSPTGERPGIGSGLAERRKHTCKGCGAVYTHTNTTLLRLYLDAIASGHPEIRLRYRV